MSKFENIRSDKKVIFVFSILLLAVLLLTFGLPIQSGGRLLTAFLLLPSAVLGHFLIRKRSIASINKAQVLLVMAVVAVVCVTLYYMSGLRFGFYQSPYGIRANVILQFILPIAAIVVCSEIIRNILLAQNTKWVSALSYIICVVSEVLIFTNLSSITDFNRFMDFVGLTLFPAITANVLYHYLSKRYGMLPNIAYRLIITLHTYLIPISSGISDSMLAFIKLILPLAIYKFIELLYESKMHYAKGRRTRVSVIVFTVTTVIMAFVMVGTVVVTSNQFNYGVYVIGSESMTGELNKGDAAIYEEYDGQLIKTGQILAFEKDGSITVHSVVDIEIIDGEYRYYTQGDTNEDLDNGYITNGNIIGIITMKLPYVGYPTLWIRELFAEK